MTSSSEAVSETPILPSRLTSRHQAELAGVYQADSCYGFSPAYSPALRLPIR